NDLITLPPLPSTLSNLRCGSNQLTALPALPPALSYLDCAQNQLGALPTLPNGLGSLYCGNNLLTSLPTLPPSLSTLGCWTNLLSGLPALPAVQNLYCGENMLTSLPTLPNSLRVLQCHENQLTALPDLPSQLFNLQCQDNQIACFPLLPNSLETIISYGNQLNCLPNIPVDFLPGPSNLGFPVNVCQVAGSDCPLYDEAATGNVFHDDNGNGVRDVGEPAFSLAVVEAQPGNFLSAPDPDGNYVLPLDVGTFTLDGRDVLYHPRTTPAYNFTLSALQIDSLNHIGYQAIPGIYDLVVDLSTIPARPGHDNIVFLTVTNVGTESAMATIDVSFDMDQSIVSSDSLPDLQNGNDLSWSATIAPYQSWTNRVLLHTDTLVALGTPILHSFSAFPQMPDSTPANNARQYAGVVVAAFDPNDKSVDPEQVSVQEVQAGTFVEYTIRFQNTGTAPALRVVITDTLSSDLNWGSMEYLSGSHDNTWYVQNGVLYFVHDPILLPDSTANEPASHGYVKFRMRPNSPLMVGEQIENVANIYFDFNEPVITEPAVFEVALPTVVPSVDLAGVLLYPNPTTGRVTLVAQEAIERIEVLQLDGRLLRSHSANSNRIDLDLSELATGLYVVRVHHANEQFGSQLLMLE
ncbi:MAG: DUF11 domain-containing protein, partial [Flavobacteriales bacterium]|nr:DUF11 domain-containing protein [Flavobacteriales bacterium]